jgi:stage II sporulation protein D
MNLRFYLTMLLSWVMITGTTATLSVSEAGLVMDTLTLPSTVKVRLFTDFQPGYAFFTVDSGLYRISNGTYAALTAARGEMMIITKFQGKIIVKKRNGESITGDTVEIRGSAGNDYFSLQINQVGSNKRSFTGDLKCFDGRESLFLVNTMDIEKYVAGVVKAEGGGSLNKEYYKTQSIIARTYIYKYLNKHALDKFDVCDCTHCQAFNGLISDSLIIDAVRSTDGLVITTPDSVLIISAFHSNCGGETSPSEDAWVTGQSYLKKVFDPWCRNSRNALWEKKISLERWSGYLRMNGNRDTTGPTGFNFIQNTRVADYTTGSFTIPLRILRNDFDLRSTFFSVYAADDSVTLKGRGFGHGVGLCQEGAMVMANNGFTFKQIIEFYYSGVLVMDIKNAVLLPKTGPPVTNKGDLNTRILNPL